VLRVQEKKGTKALRGFCCKTQSCFLLYCRDHESGLCSKFAFQGSSGYAAVRQIGDSSP